MPDELLSDRVERLEKTVEGLQTLPAEVAVLGERVGSVETQIVQLRGEMRVEFSDVRTEMRTEFAAVRSEMRTEFAGVRDERHAEAGSSQVGRPACRDNWRISSLVRPTSSSGLRTPNSRAAWRPGR